MFDIIFKETEIGLKSASYTFESSFDTLVVKSVEISNLYNDGFFNESEEIDELYEEAGEKFITGVQNFFKRIFIEIKNFFTKITNTVVTKITEMRIDYNIELIASSISKIDKSKLNESIKVCDTTKYSSTIKSLINSGYGGLKKITKEYGSPEIAEEEFDDFMSTLDHIDNDISDILEKDSKEMKFSNALNMVKMDKKNILNLLKEYNTNLSKAIKEAEIHTNNEDDINKIRKLQLFSTKLVSLVLKHIKNLINKLFSNIQKIFNKIAPSKVND